MTPDVVYEVKHWLWQRWIKGLRIWEKKIFRIYGPAKIMEN